MSRLPAGGRIARDQPISFTFNGRQFTGYRGDTLASALLANGVHRIGESIEFGRPRGIVTAGSAEPSALVQLHTPFPEPMLTATTVELFDGLVARGLSGRGELAGTADPARYDRMHLHCDLLVIGAGPAGLAAALTAASSGARVVLIDDQPSLGGSLLAGRDGLDGWLADVEAALRANPRVRLLSRTTAFGCYDDGLVLALQRRTDHLDQPPADAIRQRLWRVRAGRIVLASGSHERGVVFADNDRPGIMLAQAARCYLNRYGVLAGDRVLVFITNDSAYPTAIELAGAGAQVTVADARPGISPHWQEESARHRIGVQAGTVVYGTRAAGPDGRVGAALLGPADGAPTGWLDCNLLLTSGGWNPAVQLYSQLGGQLTYQRADGCFVPAGPLTTVRVAGSAAGRFDLAGCLADGAAAAIATLDELGVAAEPAVLPPVPAPPQAQPPALLWAVTLPDHEDRAFVDLQRDSTVAGIRRAIGAGLRSVEHVKRYTTIGTAHDQGKTSGLTASAIVAESLGLDLAEVGLTSARPPYLPIGFAALAGRDRGANFDPVRVTALHDWHAEHGAVFENVGQWQRPRYYPQQVGDQLETMADAVARECRQARTAVAMMDSSTLGKITVQGADAGEFLDRMYTSVMSSLRPGSIRYGVLCGLDGMILDDGTVTRLSPTEFLLTTTTGNAATVLDWLEEFAQTEWPDLRVHLTSVTEHWATVALVGPLSRAVLAAVSPELDVTAKGFPFMSWREATVAGLPARICRISFSGELAYEINVSWWYGRQLWEALLAAGRPHQLTVYGTETMHVLRAEKGYPIIGQDTDGTVTPQDLGMEWLISKKKPDFVGKRSHRRPDNLRPDRKQLVGLLPVDRLQLLDEGAQLLADPQAVPARMLGHVTSSYRSQALGRTFALALLRGGRQRIGERLFAWQDGTIVPVTVTDPVFYDPAGDRRDG